MTQGNGQAERLGISGVGGLNPHSEDFGRPGRLGTLSSTPGFSVDRGTAGPEATEATEATEPPAPGYPLSS